MTVFLDHPNVAIDNNAIERALRGVVLGRKNHYGSKSRRGTEVAAILYSMIESAKLVGINPEEYFKTAIDAHPKTLNLAVCGLPHTVHGEDLPVN